MSKVIICADSDHYGQYIKSLVSLAGPGDELLVNDDSYLLSKNQFKPSLFVVAADSAGMNSRPDFKYEHNGCQTFFITNNGHDVAPRPGLTVFHKPLDGTRFVQSVFHWATTHKIADSDIPPTEPYLIGNNSKIRELRRKVSKVCESNVSVLICGQTGTGKGVVAQAIHNSSERRDKPFFALNCATVPSELLESELFGYKKGSFTGAWKDKAGIFELVGNGTMFLDEVAEMSPFMQAKLLQVLQEKEFCPVGGKRNIKVDARTIAATNVDLKSAMENGRFRSDLYYRLAVVRLDLPLLRERKEDIPVLGQYFLDKFSRTYNKGSCFRVSHELWELLKSYAWPGNVRELENTIKKMVAMGSEDMVREELSTVIPEKDMACSEIGWADFKVDPDRVFSHEVSLKDLTDKVAGRAEAELIQKVLKMLNGKKKAAAAALNVSYKCLLKKIKMYGL